MRHVHTDTLIRWVVHWERVEDAGYPRGNAPMWIRHRMRRELSDARGAAITELLRRGVCPSRWGYQPPWGRRVAVAI